MPHTLTRNFRIRAYECDANGHLHSTNYLRFMQETAFDATADAGYDWDRYNRLNRQWLIHESYIQFKQPLFYNDQVQVKTWVSDFRRVTSRRAYEFTDLKDGSLVAHGWSDWVFLDAESSRPARIPSGLADAFFPEGLPDSFPRREPFPKAPPPPNGVFKSRREVAFDDLDSMQHVNNARYLDFVNECGYQVTTHFGWPWQRMQAEGAAIYLRDLHIEYLQPAVLDDELEIATWVSNVRRSTSTRHFTIRRIQDGELLVRVNAGSAWVDIQTGRPIRIPQEMLEDFAPNIV